MTDTYSHNHEIIPDIIQHPDGPIDPGREQNADQEDNYQA